MYILTLLEIILVTIYCAKLINKICCKDVNFIVKVTCLISWLTNFILLILLPLDIYITFRDQELNNNQDGLDLHSREYEAIANVLMYLIYKLAISDIVLGKFHTLLDYYSNNVGI